MLPWLYCILPRSIFVCLFISLLPSQRRSKALAGRPSWMEGVKSTLTGPLWSPSAVPLSVLLGAAPAFPAKEVRPFPGLHGRWLLGSPRRKLLAGFKHHRHWALPAPFSPTRGWQGAWVLPLCWLPFVFHSSTAKTGVCLWEILNLLFQARNFSVLKN